MLDSFTIDYREALPWYIHNTKSGEEIFYEKNGIKNGIYNYQFYHILYTQPNNPYVSDHISLIYPISEKLNVKQPLRIKANLTPITPELVVYGLHTDFDWNGNGNVFKTAIYYVNSNNGYTVFENGDRVDSVANRICIFNGNIRHSGTSCTDQRFRCVINFNFVEGE